MLCLLNDLVTAQEASTPRITPLTITIPISLPSVNDIKHSAINPAIVVTELPITEENVCEIACAIARCLSPL